MVFLFLYIQLYLRNPDVLNQRLYYRGRVLLDSEIISDIVGPVEVFMLYKVGHRAL